MQAIGSFVSVVYKRMPSCEQAAKCVSFSIHSALSALSSLGSLFSSCTKFSQPSAVHVTSSRGKVSTTSAAKEVAHAVFVPDSAHAGSVGSLGNGVFGAGDKPASLSQEEQAVGEILRTNSDAKLEKEFNALIVAVDQPQGDEGFVDFEAQAAQLEQQLVQEGFDLEPRFDPAQESFQAEVASLEEEIDRLCAHNQAVGDAFAQMGAISLEEEAELLAELDELSN